MSPPQTAAAYPPPPDLAHDVPARHARYTAAIDDKGRALDVARR